MNDHRQRELRSLKDEVNRQLRAARAAATQVRVAAAHVRRGRGGHKLRPLGGSEPATRRFPTMWLLPKASMPKPGSSGLLKFGMIEDVEEIGAKFHRHRFGQVRGLGQREIEVRVIGRVEGVAALAAGMPVDAVAVGCAVSRCPRCRARRRRPDSAGWCRLSPACGLPMMSGRPNYSPLPL